MKKLLVCLLIVATVIGVAHWRGGVAVMDAPELGLRAAAASLERSALDVPSDGLAAVTIGWILRPGAYVASRLGVDPATNAGLAFAWFVSWWCWIAVIRTSWRVCSRTTGFADIGNDRAWLLVTPPWRPIYARWLSLKRWWRHFFFDAGASAVWTGFLAVLTLTYRRRDCVPLGRPLLYGIPLSQPIGLRGSLHTLVVASSGAGKTRWATMWLGDLHAKASAFVIDCDAQIVNAVGRPLEKQGHRVVNLDPFRLSSFPNKGRWNALAELDYAAERHGRESVVRYAQTIAEALVVDDNEHQKIFANVARQFAHGLILYVWLFEPPENRNLVRVRELAANGMPERVIDPKQDPFTILLHAMKEANRFDDQCDGTITDVIVRAASLMESGQRQREGNPFRSSLLTATAWLDLPEMAAINRTSDFACADLKLSNTCVFITAPVLDMQNKLSGWARLLTVLTWYAFANIPKRLSIPSVWIIDECPSLRIQALDTAAPVARTHGMRLVLITQDLEKMMQAYPKSHKGFAGNAMAVLWMGTNHADNLETLSNELGTCLRKEKVEGGWFSKTPARYQLVERKLAHPHQLRELLDTKRGWMIVTRAGRPPILLAMETPEKALPVWKLNPDPNYGENLPRELFRKIVGWFESKK